MDPLVTIIIPALNEEKTIGSCLEKVKSGCVREDIPYEIIIADSSTDSTPDIARSFGARVISPEKRGYGNAYRSAFPYAKGEIIVIGDADDTYDFAQIPELIKPIQEGRVDMVIGSRLKGKILPGSMPWLHQYLGNPLLTWLLNFTFHSKFSDTHSGMRAISKDALSRLTLHTGGMEFASEMLIEAARKGLTFEEIPITYYPRISPSNLHSFADGWRHIRFIMLLRPLPFLFIPGFLFSVIGLLLNIMLIFRGNIENFGLHSFILSALFIIGGIELILMGLVMKAYAITHQFDSSFRFRKFLDYHSLEWLLATGSFLSVSGLFIGGYVVISWALQGFGELSLITASILAMTLLLTGIQIISHSILISMMLLFEDQSDNSEKIERK